MSSSLITFFFQLAEDAYSSYDDFSDLPEASKFIYMVNLIYLVTGIFSALTGSLGILGTYKDSKCILCTSAVLYTIILLTIAALLIFFCTQHPTGSSIDPTVIVCSVWIIMSIVGGTLSFGLAGVTCQWFSQEEAQDLSTTMAGVRSVLEVLCGFFR